MKRVAKEVILDFAKSAAKAYLERKVSLNDSIAKLASSNELLPDQIEYLAAESNKTVWKHLFEKSAQSAYEFDIANPSKILDILGTSGTRMPIVANGIDRDYEDMPVKTAEADFDLAKYLGVEVKEEKHAEEMVKKASIETSNRDFEKRAKHLESELLHLKHKIYNTDIDFIKQARNEIINVPFADRTEALKDLGTFMAGTSFNKEMCLELLQKVAVVLEKTGAVEKVAMNEVSEELINRNIDAKIINGDHALYITLKQCSELRDYEKEIERDMHYTREQIVRL